MQVKNITKMFALLATISMLAIPANAANYTHSDKGAKATVRGKTLYLKDVSDDGRFHSARYKYDNGNSEAGLTNKAGYQKTTSVTELSNINRVKLCKSQWGRPMTCGSWSKYHG